MTNTIEFAETTETLKATCLNCGNEIWAEKLNTAGSTEGSYYYSLRDASGTKCKGGKFHVPTQPRTE